MAIFSFRIVLFIVDHLSMWFILCEGAEAPFMFRVAIRMFALFFIWVWLFVPLGEGAAVSCMFPPVAYGGARRLLGISGMSAVGAERGILVGLFVEWVYLSVLCRFQFLFTCVPIYYGHFLESASRFGPVPVPEGCCVASSFKVN
jgi:hypothetical protein